MTAATKATTEPGRAWLEAPSPSPGEAPLSVPAQSGVFEMDPATLRVPIVAPLGPGLHAAYLEAFEPAAGPGGFRVRTLGGVRLSASAADGVEPALLEHCLRSNQLVMLSESPRGVLILGALQIQQTFQREPDGTVVLEAKRIELRAAEELRAQSGASALKLQAEGKVRVNGHRMIIDVDTNVRVLSALVELP